MYIIYTRRLLLYKTTLMYVGTYKKRLARTNDLHLCVPNWPPYIKSRDDFNAYLMYYNNMHWKISTRWYVL